MKKLLFGLVATIMLSNLSFGQNSISEIEKKLVNDFVMSKDFTKNSFINVKKFDLTKAFVNYSEDDYKTPKINLPVFDLKGKLLGSLEAVKKSSSTYIKLPNDNSYFIMFRDFNNFNFETLTGKILMYDNNYDNYLFNTINYEKGNSISYNFVNCPIEIKEKYSDIISFNSSNLSKLPGRKVPCDSNGNGNVSFSECYFCFNGACSSNPTCFTMCMGIGDAAGWTALGFPHCQASIGLACVYIAAAY